MTVDRLSVEFKGFRLNNISFNLKPGSITGLLGHNGAGKTTVLRLIMGMIRKDGGQVRIGNLDHILEEKKYKSRIGFVPEESFFYGRMTVAEFAGFAAALFSDWNPGRSRELMVKLHLDPAKRMGELSKGNRMKVSLLIALSHEPDVLLLDEPTSGLDPRTRAEILKLMEDIAHKEGRAVLMSTHNLRELEQIADRVIVVENGTILADENVSSFRDGHGSLEEYYLEITQ